LTAINKKKIDNRRGFKALDPITNKDPWENISRNPKS